MPEVAVDIATVTRATAVALSNVMLGFYWNSVSSELECWNYDGSDGSYTSLRGSIALGITPSTAINAPEGSGSDFSGVGECIGATAQIMHDGPNGPVLVWKDNVTNSKIMLWDIDDDSIASVPILPPTWSTIDHTLIHASQQDTWIYAACLGDSKMGIRRFKPDGTSDSVVGSRSQSDPASIGIIGTDGAWFLDEGPIFPVDQETWKATWAGSFSSVHEGEPAAGYRTIFKDDVAAITLVATGASESEMIKNDFDGETSDALDYQFINGTPNQDGGNRAIDGDVSNSKCITVDENYDTIAYNYFDAGSQKLKWGDLSLTEPLTLSTVTTFADNGSGDDPDFVLNLEWNPFA